MGHNNHLFSPNYQLHTQPSYVIHFSNDKQFRKSLNTAIVEIIAILLITNQALLTIL